MMKTISLAPSSPVRDTLTDGLLASAISAALLVWRGRSDGPGAFAPLNAVSHWIWPNQAMRREDASWRHTATGSAIHVASSLLWAAVYDFVRERRRDPTPLNAIADAAAVTALAATVDLKLVPRRLTPGFERKITTPSLAMVYGGFALGLAIGGVAALRR